MPLDNFAISFPETLLSLSSRTGADGSWQIQNSGVKPHRETAVYSRYTLWPRVFWKYGTFFLHNRALSQCFGQHSRDVREMKVKYSTRKWNQFFNSQSNLAFLDLTRVSLSIDRWSKKPGISQQDWITVLNLTEIVLPIKLPQRREMLLKFLSNSKEWSPRDSKQSCESA